MTHLYRGITKDAPRRWVFGGIYEDADHNQAFIIYKSPNGMPIHCGVMPETVGVQINWLFGQPVYQHDYDFDGNMLTWCDRCLGWQFFTIDIPTRDIIHCNNCEGNFMVQDHIPEFIAIGTIHDHLLNAAS